MKPGLPPRARRRTLGGLLILAALMAGLLVAATLAGGASRSPHDAQAQAFAELEGGHVHGGTIADLRADRKRDTLCARAAYRAAHAANCPSGRGGFGAAVATGQFANVTANPEVTGRWAAPFKVPLWPIHEILLPTGKVLWLMKGETSAFTAPAYLWDPATNTTKRVDAPNVTYPDGSVKPANLWCSGHTVLPDGRVLVAGGNLAYRNPAGGPGSGYKGPRWIFIFDPWTEKWTRQPDMRAGRWYPTVITLPDGRALIMGGWDENGNDEDNPDVEVFTPAPRGAGVGSVKVVAQRVTALYPKLLVVPDTSAAGSAPGTQVLVAGPSPGDTAILNVNDWSWKDVPNIPTSRTWGSAIMLPGTGATGSHKVMVIGGYDERVDPATQRSTAILDLDNINAGWKAGPTMANGRSHLNVVITPDDALIAMGGGAGRGDYNGSLDSFYAGPVYATERLDPNSGAWGPADTQADERTYHSTGLLLPDATVLSAGDDRASHTAGNRTGEIYSPPYMFKGGTRPAITFAPDSVRYNVSFRVATQQPLNIDRAVLVRPSSVTHATDDERVLRLSTTVQGDGVTIVSPVNQSIAPPGYYMLFLVDKQGRVSKADFVLLSQGAPDAPQVPGGTTPIPPPGTPPPDVDPGTPSGGAGGTAAGGGATVTHAPGTVTKPRRAAAKVRATVRWVSVGPGTLRVVLRVSVRARKVTRVAFALPTGKAGKTDTRRRTVGKGPARGAIVAIGFRTPGPWTVLTVPMTIADGPGKPERARLVVTMRKGKPVGVLKAVR